ncbi:MAG: alpha/beta fold hydrolase [Cyanobacteriota bacterium]|nr:alpha/beta fold hydrolase [Cyanobacteriota bacterium]
MRLGHHLSKLLKHLGKTLTVLSIPAIASLATMPVSSQHKAIPTLEDIDCPIRFQISYKGESMRCGYLHVPENRAQADSPTIKVFFAVLAPYSRLEEPDPIVTLAGGPGQAMSDLIALDLNALAGLHQRRAIVIIDQRGVGLSEPVLQVNGAKPEEIIAGLKEMNIDLKAYNTTQSALDLKDLREELGYKQWNILGTSYGTKLALETMRVDPEGIRSVVLNSTVAPMHNTFSEDVAKNHKLNYDRLFSDCATDPECAEAFPNLRQTFLEIAETIGDDGITITYKDDSQTEQSVKLNLKTVIRFFHSEFEFGSVSLIPLQISTLAAVIQGEESINNPVLGGLLNMAISEEEDNDQELSGSINLGLLMTINCYEEWSEITNIEQFQQSLEPYKSFTVIDSVIEDFQEVCEGLNLGRVNPEFSQPVESEIPTLLLSGFYDTQTPPLWTDQAVASLKNGQAIYFNAIGHDVVDNLWCSHAIVEDFIENPRGRLSSPCSERTKTTFVTTLEDLK